MTDLTTIQEKIGARIAESRKALGLTMKALAERTENLKPSRINNWERGARTPGPEEAVQLAKALEISPGYLLGLTDDITAGLKPNVPGFLQSIPLFNFDEACNLTDDLYENSHSYIPLGKELEGKASEKAFALKIKDDSMSPGLKPADIVIVEISGQPNPGDLVVAKIARENEAIVRQYKQTSYSGSFELIATNPNWPQAAVNSTDDGSIIGILIEARHYF